MVRFLLFLPVNVFARGGGGPRRFPRRSARGRSASRRPLASVPVCSSHLLPARALRRALPYAFVLLSAKSPMALVWVVCSPAASGTHETDEWETGSRGTRQPTKSLDRTRTVQSSRGCVWVTRAAWPRRRRPEAPHRRGRITVRRRRQRDGPPSTSTASTAPTNAGLRSLKTHRRER